MITDVLIKLIKPLIHKGFEFPIYILAISSNENLVVAKYEWDLIEKDKVNVLLEDVKSKDWELPVNCFIVDKKGEAEMIKVTEETIKTYQ